MASKSFRPAARTFAAAITTAATAATAAAVAAVMLTAGLVGCSKSTSVTPTVTTAAASAGAARNVAPDGLQDGVGGPADSPVQRRGATLTVPANSPLRLALQVAVVTESDVQRPIAVPGVIEADASRLIRVVAPVAGRIERLYKRLGDPVRVGDALFSLDSADLASATSDAAKAHAALTLAERNLARQQELVAAEIAARKDLEQAQNDQAQALSEARRTQARLAQLGIVEGPHSGAAAPGSGRLYTMKAALAGHVIEQTGAQGGFWNDTNAPVLTIADLSSVWLTASVQEKDLAAVFVGQHAQITLTAYPGEPLVGKVAYIAQVLDADTRTVKVRVALANPLGRLRPGMFASAVFSAATHRAVTVPAAALIQDGFNTRVFVETRPWTYESRIVKTGAQVSQGTATVASSAAAGAVQSAAQVEIEAGLKAGERIVVKDAVLLHD